MRFRGRLNATFERQDEKKRKLKKWKSQCFIAPMFYERGQAYSYTEICSETYPAVIDFVGLFKVKF